MPSPLSFRERALDAFKRRQLLLLEMPKDAYSEFLHMIRRPPCSRDHPASVSSRAAMPSEPEEPASRITLTGAKAVIATLVADWGGDVGRAADLGQNPTNGR
jgi:hypothetical protein